MSSILQPNILIFKVDAAVAKGLAVKAGASSDENVQKASASSDKLVGIAQNDTTTAGDLAEIAVAGGGAKAKLGGSVSFGDLLTADSDAKLVATTSNAAKVIAQAMQDGSTDDLISVIVIPGIV
jgi:hypothetical protein